MGRLWCVPSEADGRCSPDGGHRQWPVTSVAWVVVPATGGLDWHNSAARGRVALVKYTLLYILGYSQGRSNPSSSYVITLHHVTSILREYNVNKICGEVQHRMAREEASFWLCGSSKSLGV